MFLNGDGRLTETGQISCCPADGNHRLHYIKKGGSDLHYIKKDGSDLITECRVPELIPVLGSQPAGDVSHKPGGRLPLLSVRPAVTLATLKRAAASFAAW